ncbi:MAG: hypothetical protein M3220_14455 [Chloroflexota bacterium]|nr:hypothetical protein [Chloroflexota bacterium]
MQAFEALWLAARDTWEELFLVLLLGPLGALLSLLILPVPFVLAAHYGIAERISDERAVGWREWFQLGREHAAFFYKWAGVVLLVTLVLLANLRFYSRFEPPWSLVAQGMIGMLLFLWLLFQPLVPALYFQQRDRRLRITFRNAVVIALAHLPSLLLLWVAVLLIVLLLLLFAWPLMPLLSPTLVFIMTRFVHLHIT